MLTTRDAHVVRRSQRDVVLVCVFKLDRVRLDEHLAHGDDELFERHVWFELEESNVVVQEEFHLNLFRFVHLGRFKRLQAIDFVHHLLNVFVEALNLFLGAHAQLFLCAHGLL